MSAPGGVVATAEPLADDQRTPAQRSIDERDWSFGGAWPYAPRWHHTQSLRLHYVDEGPRDAAPIVMLHGNPTWSFLYRKLIARFTSDRSRAIAPDQLGFGRSDKPHRMREHSITRHCRLFDSLLAALELRDVTLVAHDWGGPVALWWATHHPDRVRALALVNTFITPPRRRNGLASRMLEKGAHRSLRRAMEADGAGRRLSPYERQAYAAPHPSWDSRTGILALSRANTGRRAAGTRAFVELTITGLRQLRDTPTLIVRGMDDSVLPASSFDEQRRLFPEAKVLGLEGVGHLAPDFASEPIAEAVLELRRGARES